MHRWIIYFRFSKYFSRKKNQANSIIGNDFYIRFSIDRHRNKHSILNIFYTLNFSLLNHHLTKRFTKNKINKTEMRID
jgi:hypothetical protein